MVAFSTRKWRKYLNKTVANTKVWLYLEWLISNKLSHNWQHMSIPLINSYFCSNRVYYLTLRKLSNMQNQLCTSKKLTHLCSEQVGCQKRYLTLKILSPWLSTSLKSWSSNWGSLEKKKQSTKIMMFSYFNAIKYEDKYSMPHFLKK